MLRTLALFLLLLLPALAQDGENSHWEKKLAIVPTGTAANATARPPEIPADPQPAQTFTTGNVFSDPQLYVRFVLGPQGIDWSRTSTRWYFLPDGRTYVKMCDPQANVTEFWGRYQIDGEGNLSVATDAGEKISMALQHGRRKLVWDDSTYTNIYWENEVLQRNAP